MMARMVAMLPHEYLTEMSELTDEEFGRLCRMLLRYSRSGEIPEPVGNERFYVQRVINYEDTLQGNYEAKCEKRRAAGKLGGLAKARNAKQILANGSKDEQDVTNVGKTKTKTNTKTKTKTNIRENNKRETAQPEKPTLEEVTAYCRQRGNSINPQAFLDYYEQQGWRLANGNKLKDWRAAVRTWEQREAARSSGKPKRPYGAGQISQEDNNRALKQIQRLMDEMQEG